MPLLIALVLFLIPLSQANAIENAVSITQKECERLINKYSVSGADYIPGKGARGQDVIGADLNGGSPIKMPEEIIFDIGIDLAEKYGFGAGGQYTGKATLGQVKVKGNKVYWNDQRLNSSEADAVLEACRDQYEN